MKDKIKQIYFSYKHWYVYFLKQEGLYWTIVRQFLYKNAFIKKILTPVVDFLKPPVVYVDGHTLYIDKQDDIVSLELIINKRWEKFETDLFKKYLKKGDVVVDVGAHIGWYSLIAARSVGDTGRVYAFEPDPKSFELLKKNIAANGYTNIVAVRKALSNKQRKTKLFLNDSRNLTQNSLYSFNKAARSISVETTTLDDYFHDKKQKVSVLKMDIQGGEANVLLGAKRTLDFNKQMVIFTEFSPDRQSLIGLSPYWLIKFLIKNSFEIFNMVTATSKIEPVTLRNLENIHYFTDGETNLLCLRSKKKKLNTQ